MRTLTRRHSLQAWLAGTGFAGLRAMATVLPLSFLVDPRSVRADAPGGTHRIGQEGAAAEGMEDLGTGRAHPLGLAGCQNDGGELIHGIDHRSTRHAT